MITGKVKSEVDEDGYVYLKPQITVRISGINSGFLNQDATVDTGFTGWLALPEDTIQELELTRYGQRPASQASGEASMYSIYGALVSWHGEGRPVLVHQITGTPLIGMALLEGSRLTVDAQEGGDVIIEKIP